MRLELEQQFDALAGDDAAALLEVARERGGNRKCFMCDWIVKKVKMDEFPLQSRKIHLMLDCFPILEAHRNEAN